MNKKLIFCIVGVIFTILSGTLLHFLYDLSGENKIVALFSAVNESTWEHLKLLFFPVIIFGIIDYFAYGKSIKGFVPIKIYSALMGIAVIVILFYTYTGILGYNVLPLDLLIFVVSTISAYCYSYRNITKETVPFTSNCALIVSIIMLILFIAAFFVFTFYPPEIGLFRDPITLTYGI